MCGSAMLMDLGLFDGGGGSAGDEGDDKSNCGDNDEGYVYFGYYSGILLVP